MVTVNFDLKMSAFNDTIYRVPKRSETLEIRHCSKLKGCLVKAIDTKKYLQDAYELTEVVGK